MAKVIFQNSRKFKGEWVTPFLPYDISDSDIAEAEKLGATILEGATQKVEPKVEPKEEPKVEIPKEEPEVIEEVRPTEMTFEEPKETPKKKGRKK